MKKFIFCVLAGTCAALAAEGLGVNSSGSLAWGLGVGLFIWGVVEVTRWVYGED